MKINEKKNQDVATKWQRKMKTDKGENDGDTSSEYAYLSPESTCVVSNLTYIADEAGALAGADNILKSYLQSNNGPTILVSNTIKPQLPLRIRHL